jgi:hypothetical protein
MPLLRNRTRTFLCPSLWNRLVARSSRMAITNASSTDHWLWSRTLLACLGSAGRVRRRGRQPDHFQDHTKWIGFTSCYRFFADSHFDERPLLSRMNWSFFSCNSNSIACFPIFFYNSAIFVSSRLFPFNPVMPPAMKSSRQLVSSRLLPYIPG